MSDELTPERLDEIRTAAENLDKTRDAAADIRYLLAHIDHLERRLLMAAELRAPMKSHQEMLKKSLTAKDEEIERLNDDHLRRETKLLEDALVKDEEIERLNRQLAEVVDTGKQLFEQIKIASRSNDTV